MKTKYFSTALLLLATASAQSPLALKPGTYVAAGTACQDAPLAAMQTVDHFGIQYPHLWGCKASVTEHHGKSYSLDQVCNGGEHDKIVVTVLARDRYSVGSGKTAQVYRFCSARTQ